jgi:hypothetical protein
MEEATFNMIDLPVELGKLRIENVIPKAMNSSNHRGIGHLVSRNR